MSEPNRCSVCGKTIAPNQSLCYEHFVDYWLDEEFEGEGGTPPDYHEDWDDVEFPDDWEDEDD